MVRFRLFALLCFVAGCHQLFGLDPLPDVPASDGQLADTPAGPCGHRSVSTGRHHSCAIDMAGSVWCWGDNTNWQVKAGESDSVLVPVKLDLPTAAVQVAAGRSASCARLVDGSVWCWGNNEDGELGRGTQDARLPAGPVELAGERAIDVDVGAYHVCIRRESDSAVMCWGTNRYSEVGLSAGASTATPTLVAGSAGMQRLSVGHRHSCGLTASGTVQCWGKGDEGQLGSGVVTTSMLTQAAGIANAAAVSASGRATCVVASDGVRCWGDNDHGQLGRGTFSEAPAPGSVVVPAALDVALATRGGCALRADGGVECWGGLPPGDGTFSTSVLPRPSSVASATAIAAAFHHACVIVDGTVQCWGDNTFGALGRGTIDVALTPTAVALPASVTAVSVGTETACALLTGGEVRCWGDNSYGALGDGTRSSIHTAVTVTSGITGIVGVVAGYDRACAWNATSARCWGTNKHAVLGTGTASRDRLSPAAVTVATNLKSIVLGASHTCAITSTNSVLCWGDNAHGQLGNNTTTDSASGVTASNGPILQIAAGGNHTCARKSDETLICWGENVEGQIGNNSTNDVTGPVTISGLTSVTDVSAGRRHTCAIAAGNLYCWGNNAHGELGLGDRTDRLTPVQVALPAPPVDVELGHASTCVRVTGGKVYCWGDNDRGELGIGAAGTAEGLPTEIPLMDAEAISLGGTGGCARRSGGLQCWGVSALLANGDVSSAEPRPTMLACP